MLQNAYSKAELRWLRVFIVVVESKGLSAAQAVLNVSTSTISRHITDLEIRLGMRLCQRGRAGFRVTDKGEIVYHAAKKMFLSMNEFEETVSGARGHLVGHLALGVVDSWIANDSAPIVEALSKFNKAAPDADVELHSLASDGIEFGVFDGRIPVGIGVFHTPKPGLNYKDIGEEYMGLYCGEGHPLFKNCTEEQLAQADLARRAYLNEEKVAPITRGMRSSASAHQIEGVAILILTGKHIGYLPPEFAEIWVREGRMKSVANGRYDTLTKIQLVTKTGHKPTLVEKTFIKYLTSQAQA